MRSILYTILHGLVGGAAVGVSLIPTDQPFTLHNVLLPILASAGTSIISGLLRSPLKSQQ